MCSSLYTSDSSFANALSALKDGGIVAYPTETFYGLAVDPENDLAIASLYELKNREEQKAISLLIPDLQYLSKLVQLTPLAYGRLIETFWPGPLTLIFPAHDTVPRTLTGQDKTIAIRISSNPFAEKLCRSMGKAITATSANVSGERPEMTASGVKRLFGDKIACIIDGGPTPGGKGSTIIRCLNNKKECQFIRDGAITRAAIGKALPFGYTICNV